MSDGNGIIVGGNMQSKVGGEELPIKLCDDHHKDLMNQLGVHVDYHHQAFHILAVIAGRAMGSDNLVKLKCPVCAMQEFDWIKNVVGIVTENVATPKLVVPS